MKNSTAPSPSCMQPYRSIYQLNQIVPIHVHTCSYLFLSFYAGEKKVLRMRIEKRNFECGKGERRKTILSTHLQLTEFFICVRNVSVCSPFTACCYIQYKQQRLYVVVLLYTSIISFFAVCMSLWLLHASTSIQQIGGFLIVFQLRLSMDICLH